MYARLPACLPACMPVCRYVCVQVYMRVLVFIGRVQGSKVAPAFQSAFGSTCKSWASCPEPLSLKLQTSAKPINPKPLSPKPC